MTSRLRSSSATGVEDRLEVKDIDTRRAANGQWWLVRRRPSGEPQRGGDGMRRAICEGGGDGEEGGGEESEGSVRACRCMR